MTIQIYYIQLTDGRTVEMAEDYYLPAPQRLVNRYKAAQADDILTIGDQVNGFTYVPKSNILYIFTGDVVA